MTRPPQRPVSSDESGKKTRESEGAVSDGRDNTDVPRVVPVSKSAIGGIEHDEEGHARWKWNADTATSDDPNAQTFSYLKALDTNLEIEQSQKVPVLDPYNTARSKKPK